MEQHETMRTQNVNVFNSRVRQASYFPLIYAKLDFFVFLVSVRYFMHRHVRGIDPLI